MNLHLQRQGAFFIAFADIRCFCATLAKPLLERIPAPRQLRNRFYFREKTTKLLALVAAGAISLGAAQQSSAAFAKGDLIMSFQATGGEGATTTYVVNLGTGYSYRDATTNISNVINIGSNLSSIFGGEWYERSDLYVNIIGNSEAGYSPANQGGPVVNGDARNTIYASRARTDSDATTYTAWSSAAAALGAAGTQVQTYNSAVSSSLSGSNSASIPISNNNTIEEFTMPAGSLLTNFLNFGTDFNQAFGTGSLSSLSGTNYEGALTLQRINRVDGTTGSLEGNVVVDGIAAGTGSNEGFFGIRSTGQIDYFAPIPTPSPTPSPMPPSGGGAGTGGGSSAGGTGSGGSSGGGSGLNTVDWLESKPTNRQFRMAVYAKVLVDNILKSNPQNLLGAFDKNGLAGSSAPLVEDNGVFALTIWRDANTKEAIDLKFYDADSGRIYFIAEELEFSKDSQAGTLQKPIELVPLYEEVELRINIARGWNWVSFGVLPARASVERVFGDYSFTDNDLVKGANGFATFFQGKWYPEDFTLETGRMYSVRRQAEGSAVVGVIGGEKDASEEIALVKGWNWLGYTPGQAKAVGEALASLQAVNGDLIKGQSLGSVSFNNGTWVPGSAQLLPGRGYMLRLEKEQNFRFEQPALAMVNADNSNGEQPPSLRIVANTVPKVLTATLASTTVPDWRAPQGKANNMVVFATTKIDGKAVEAAGSRLSAFDGTQIAGVVEIEDGPAGKCFSLQILTDSADGATISFKAYDAASGKTVDLKETLPFQADGVVAGIDTPKPFTYTSPTPAPTGSASAPSGGGGSDQSEKPKNGKKGGSGSAKKSGNAKSKSDSASGSKKSSGGASKKSGSKKSKKK